MKENFYTDKWRLKSFIDGVLGGLVETSGNLDIFTHAIINNKVEDKKMIIFFSGNISSGPV